MLYDRYRGDCHARRFCQTQNYEHMQLSTTLDQNPAVNRMRKLAGELSVAIPVSFFERAANIGFNTVAMIDETGELQGIYRKTHIPDGLPDKDPPISSFSFASCIPLSFPEKRRPDAIRSSLLPLFFSLLSCGRLCVPRLRLHGGHCRGAQCG